MVLSRELAPPGAQTTVGVEVALLLERRAYRMHTAQRVAFLLVPCLGGSTKTPTGDQPFLVVPRGMALRSPSAPKERHHPRNRANPVVLQQAAMVTLLAGSRMVPTRLGVAATVARRLA